MICHYYSDLIYFYDILYTCFRVQKISFSDYEKFLEDLAKSKKVELEEIKKKMTDCGAPGFTGAVVSFNSYL